MKYFTIGLAAVLLLVPAAKADVPNTTFLAQAGQVRMYRGVAAPMNVGLWLENLSQASLSCTVGWRSANGSLAAQGIGDSRSVRLRPREVERVVTGLAATQYETLTCSIDATVANEDRQRQAVEAERAAAASRDQQRRESSQAGNQQGGTTTLDQQARADRDRQANSRYEQELRDQRVEVERQNALIAQQQRSYAERQRAIARQQQQQQKEALADRERRVDAAGNVLMDWARRLDEKNALQNQLAAEKGTEAEQRENEIRRQSQVVHGNEEKAKLDAAREANARKEATYAGLSSGKRPNGAKDPNHPGFLVYQVKEACTARFFEGAVKQTTVTNMSWTGSCAGGYLTGEGTFSYTATYAYETGEAAVYAIREKGAMTQGAWDGLVELDRVLVSGPSFLSRNDAGEQHRYQNGRWVSRWK